MMTCYATSGPDPTYGLLGVDLALFSSAGFDMEKIHLKRNAAVAQLYEDAIKYEGAVIASSGALINFSGKKTGRSPKDKRIVYEETSKDDIWVSLLLLSCHAACYAMTC